MLRLAKYSSVLAVILTFAVAGCASKTTSDEQGGVIGEGTPVVEAPPAEPLTVEEVEVAADELTELTGHAPESTAKYFRETVGDRVHFAYDRHDLSDEARRVLKRQALWLSINPSATLTIEGHCDERGTRSYNLALGARRAQAVKQYLVSAGVFSNRITTVSYGKERPVSLCSNESCWSVNRRGVSVVDGVPDS